MIGVTLNSKVKIINRDKYISLHGEDSVSKSNVFGNLSLLNTVLRMVKSFFVRMIRVKSIFFFRIVLLMLIMLRREASLMKQRISVTTADSLTMAMQ